MHDEQGAVMPGEALDGIEAVGKDRRLIGVAVATGIFGEADLASADNFSPQARHVVHRDKDCARPWSGGNRRGILDERIASKQSRLEVRRDLKWRKPALGAWPRARRFVAAQRGNASEHRNSQRQDDYRSAGGHDDNYELVSLNLRLPCRDC